MMLISAPVITNRSIYDTASVRPYLVTDCCCCLLSQKQESWTKPLIDQTIKEGKDKTAKFEGDFSRKDSKAKWFLKKDVSVCFKRFPLNI